MNGQAIPSGSRAGPHALVCPCSVSRRQALHVGPLPMRLHAHNATNSSHFPPTLLHQFDPLISIIAFSFSFIFFIIIISINYLYCGSSRGLILTFAWLMAASFVKFNCCGLYQLSLSSRIQQLDSRNRKKDLFVLKLNIFNPFLPLQKKKKSQILVI